MRSRAGGVIVLRTSAAILVAALVGAPVPAWAPPEGDPVPPGPERSADLPPPPAPQPRRAIAVPEGLKPGVPLTLAQILDIALRQNPVTRAAWERAITAAQELGVQKAAYYPDLDLTAGATRSKTTAFGGRFTTLQSVYGPAINLSYLLIDFGGRKGDVDEARNLLLAADWSHNSAIQDLILQVQVAYYNYLEAKARLEASDVTIRQTRTALEAAVTRHDAGVSTIADVLQAKTLVSQAELTRLTIEGSMQSLRGSLATAVGVPANTPFEVGALPDVLPAEELTGEVDRLVQTAVTRRPDLAAARLRVLAADSHIKAVRSEALPTFNLAGSVGRNWFDPALVTSYGDNWSVALQFRYTLFSGFERSYQIRKAESEARTVADVAEALEQRAVLEAWTSYYDMKTAAKRIATARDLLASADASEKVALGRYKEGVGTLLDLLTAESLLAGARAQEIEARAAWLVAVARLARDTGTLAAPAEPGAPSDPPAAENETDAGH